MPSPEHHCPHAHVATVLDALRPGAWGLWSGLTVQPEWIQSLAMNPCRRGVTVQTQVL